MPNARTRFVHLVVLLCAATACAPRPEPAGTAVDNEPVPGVSRELAQDRARTISELAYDVALSIPERRTERITGRLTARFLLSDATRPVALDFAQPSRNVLAVVANDTELAPAVVEEHIVVPPAALRSGANTMSIDFVAGDGSLNRSDEFLYTLFVPDRARVALPIFDQPDLKARYRLTLELPAAWKAVSNGAVNGRTVDAGRATVTFDETRPISTYVFAFAAGRFEVEEATRGGRRLRLFHRETDGDKVARNLEAIFDLHGVALEWLEAYTEIPYPFPKLDFVAVPAFQYGGMEHAGAIFYRDRSLFLDASATQSQVLGRASLIAHEAAHMWFGNLVTMRWFDDVWMKEVFANFMAAKIVNPSFPELDHELRFLLAHYPAAYRVDRTAGANPIRQPLENLAEAGSLYGAIIYQKAPIVMRHLERLLGEETLRDGLRDYLAAHRYANATWPDLISVLDRLTDEDLAAWSDLWVHEPGRPTVQAHLDPGAGVLRLTQTDPAGEDRLWTQRIEVVLGERAGYPLRLATQLRAKETSIELPEGRQAPAFVLANGGGYGYGDFVLAPNSQRFLLESLPTIASARLRAVAWLSLWDAVLAGRSAPDDLLDLAERALWHETEELNIQRILSDVETLYWRFLDPEARSHRAPGLESLLWDKLRTAEEATLKATWFATYRRVALTESAVGRLRALWAGDLAIDGLPLSENDTTALAQALAVRGLADAEAILDSERERVTNPDSRERFDFVRPALSADPEVRDAFFASLADAAHRERERWVLEALGFLHHPLRAARSERYIRPSLDLLEEVQRTGDIFFPLGWLAATLDGHSSRTAKEIVDGFLAESPELPARLRGKLLQAADPLFRAADVLHPEPDAP